MTKWKQRLDEQLGTDHKFSDQLAEQIEKKAKKHPFEWRYPVTLVAFIVVAMLLILVNVETVKQPEQSATPFELLIEQAEVERFYISTRRSEKHQFFAKDSLLYLGVHEFEERADAQKMQHFLQQMAAIDLKNHSLPYEFTDMVVVMTNGEQLRLKVGHSNSLIVQDVQSKIYYKVEGRAAIEFYTWWEAIEQLNILLWVLVFFVGIIALSNGLYKLFGVPKPKKKKFRWRDFLINLSSYFITYWIMGQLLKKDIVLYKPIVYSLFITLFVVSLYFEWRKNKDKQLLKINAILIGSFVIFIIYLFEKM